MARKTTPSARGKKSPAAKKKAAPVRASAQAARVNIHGNVNARRDVIMGDQTNYIQIAEPHSAAEFRAALALLQQQIADLKKQSGLNAAQARTLDVVEGKLAEAAREAAGPRPLGERMRATLTEARETMDLLTGSIQSAAALGGTLGTLALAAIKLFGG